MRRLDILRLRWRSLFRRTALDRDLAQELQLHLDLQIERNLAAGMAPAEAHAAALRDFGSPALHQDECRDARRTALIEEFLDDFCHALRGLRRDPLLAFAATTTLAVSIGANTTVFSMADSILIRPLPYPGADRIDWISERSGPGRQDVGTAPGYYRLRDQNRIFESVADLQPITVNWTGIERPEQLDAAAVSPSFFRVMGSPPLMGRYFTPSEEGPKVPRIVVLSYDFWRSRLGSDPHILGKTIGLDRLPRIVVGVMPQGFDFPRGARLWLPSDLDESLERPISLTRGIRIVSLQARRKPSVTPNQATAEMRGLTASIRAEYRVFRATGFRSDLSIEATPLQQHTTGQLRPALLVLTGAVALVLLIACANLASLLLARAGARQRR